MVSSNTVKCIDGKTDFTERSVAMKGTYEKPVLVKHEPLRDVTASNTNDVF